MEPITYPVGNTIPRIEAVCPVCETVIIVDLDSTVRNFTYCPRCDAHRDFVIHEVS